MENRELSALAEAIAGRIFVELEASGRHVHVTAQQALVLFGHPLTPKRPLSQPGQYLSNERVTVIGPKGEFRNVAVLGPGLSRAPQAEEMVLFLLEKLERVKLQYGMTEDDDGV